MARQLTPQADKLVLLFLILYYIYIGVGCALVLIRRNRTPISQRGWPLSIIGCIMSTFGLLSSWITFSPRFPADCTLRIWISSFFFISWLFTYPLRAMLLYFHTQWNIKKLRPKRENDQDFWFPKYAFLTSKKFNLLLYVGVILLNELFVFFITRAKEADTEAIVCYPQMFFLQIAWAIFLIITGILTIYLLWNVQDAYSLKKELKVFLFLVPIGFAVYVITQVLSSAHPLSAFAPFVILLACGITSSAITLYYPVIVSFQKVWVRRHESQLSLSDDLFNHCLRTPALLQAFQKYCLESWCVENLQFYLEVQEFRLSIEEGAGKGRAKQIIEQYIDSKALLLINIDDNIQKEILEDFDQGNITPSLFEKAEQMVLQQMNQDTFSKFKISGGLAHAWKDAGLGELIEDDSSSSRSRRKRTTETELEMEKPEISQTGLELLGESMTK